MSGATTEVRDIDGLIEGLLAKAGAEGLSALFDSMPLSDALRELLRLSPKERDAVLSLLPSEKAARLIEEAPNEMAVELVERLEAGKAAEIMEELDSDIQADVIGELKPARCRRNPRRNGCPRGCRRSPVGRIRRLYRGRAYGCGGFHVS